MAKATARHILVESEEICLELKREIEQGADFGDVAKELETSFVCSSVGVLIVGTVRVV